MKHTLLKIITLITVLSIAPVAKSDELDMLYNSCYQQGNSRSCGMLGELCGRGNYRACNLINTISNGGLVQINYYCRQRGLVNACIFLQELNNIGGVGNLGRLCGQGYGQACNMLGIISCYARENARGGICGLLN